MGSVVVAKGWRDTEIRVRETEGDEGVEAGTVAAIDFVVVGIAAAAAADIVEF